MPPSPSPSRPAPRSRRRTASSPVVTLRPDAAVWQQALTLADGDARRIEVLPDGSVVVRNQPVR